jgi:integrase
VIWRERIITKPFKFKHFIHKNSPYLSITLFTFNLIKWHYCVVFSKMCVARLNMIITEKKLNAIHGKKRKSTIEIPDRDGLVVSCGLSGKLSWVFRYRFDKKQKRFTLGSYPALSLAGARMKTIECVRALENDEDPKYASTKGERISIETCKEPWIKNRFPELRQSSQTLYQSHANKYFTLERFPHDIQTARFEYWLAYFDQVAKETNRGNAGAIHKTLNTMLKWCRARNIIQSSVFFDIDFNAVGKPPNRGERNLQMYEVGTLWVEIGQTHATPAIKACSKLLVIFGARNSEIREALRTEFDLERAIWTLPSSRSKTNKVIRRPIPDMARRIILDLDDTYGMDGYLIPGLHNRTHMTAHSLNRFIIRTWGKMSAKSKIEKFTPHDFRRTLATRLSEREVLPHVTEKMLGHELGGIMAVYNKHDWIDEQLKAYELWCEMISEAAQEQLSDIF